MKSSRKKELKEKRCDERKTENVLDLFKIGMFTLGGGYAMISLFEEEVVRKRNGLHRTNSRYHRFGTVSSRGSCCQ